jgi:hypothetical protein
LTDIVISGLDCVLLNTFVSRRLTFCVLSSQPYRVFISRKMDIITSEITNEAQPLLRDIFHCPLSILPIIALALRELFLRWLQFFPVCQLKAVLYSFFVNLTPTLSVVK